MPVVKALALARQHDLDLVEVAPHQNPPVCRLLDYGKYKYEQAKKAKKAQQAGSLSEIRLRPRIKEHDIMAKAKQVLRLLEEGSKVKVTIQFRGREVTHPELGWRALQVLAQHLKGNAAVEKPPALEGESQLTVIFSPLKEGAKGAQAKNPQSSQKTV